MQLKQLQLFDEQLCQRILIFQRIVESYATEWKWNSLENESVYKYFLELLYIGVKDFAPIATCKLSVLQVIAELKWQSLSAHT